MIKGMTLKGGNRFSLIIGFGCAIVATVLIIVFLTNAKSDGGGGGSSVSGPAVPVAVASVNIPLGTKIDASMVKLQDTPESGVLPGAFDNAEAVVGQVTTVRVVSGEQIISDKITSTGENLESFGDNPPLALVVTEGMRGSSVEVNSIVGAGGNLRPGDYVDVVLSVSYDTENKSIAGGKNQASAIVVQNVQVLAIDQAVAGSQADAPDDQKDADSKATTVTLLATPIQSELLALSDTCRLNFDGRIGLSVRSFGDESKFAPRNEWPGDGPTPDCFTLMGIDRLR